MFRSIQKTLIISFAAGSAMLALMNRQQDLGLETSADTLKKRASDTAHVAVTFASALYNELIVKGF